MGDLRRSKRKRVSSSSADPRNEALERVIAHPPRNRKNTNVIDPVPKITLSVEDLIDSHEEWYAYKYPDSECAHSYENSGHARGNIEDAMERILNDFTKEGATFETRMNGVTSCIEIADLVTGVFDEMGSHDVKWFSKTRVIEDAIITIAKTFTGSEKKKVWETLGADIERVKESAKEFYILKGFVDVIKILKGRKKSSDRGN